MFQSLKIRNKEFNPFNILPRQLRKVEFSWWSCDDGEKEEIVVVVGVVISISISDGCWGEIAKIRFFSTYGIFDAAELASMPLPRAKTADQRCPTYLESESNLLLGLVIPTQQVGHLHSLNWHALWATFTRKENFLSQLDRLRAH